MLGINTIWDIYEWEIGAPNRWAGWAIPECPEELNDERNLLMNHLSGLAPVAKFRKDRRGWGRHSDSYSESKGYQKFAATPNVLVNPAIWNHLWNCKSFPKIDMFIWTLLHERVLTGKNLEKRGFTGPFRCPLCAEATKNISHLFLICPYAISVWREVLNRWEDGIHLLDKIQKCFFNWDKLYNGELIQKKGLRACWMKLPKIIYWCIWNERNHKIFQDKT